MPTIGLIGLGNAGRPMGERILAQGYTLTVYDLNPATVEGLVRGGARAAALCPGGCFRHYAHSPAVIDRSEKGCFREGRSLCRSKTGHDVYRSERHGP